MPEVNISKTKDHLGRYASRYPHILFEQVAYGSDYLRDGSVITINNEATAGMQVGIPNDTITEVWQGMYPEFQAKGNIHFSVEATTQRQHKINVPIYPEALVGQWEGVTPTNGTVLYDETKGMKKQPLARFAWNKILKRVQKDRDTKVFMRGKYVAPTGGTPPPAEESVDGIYEVLRKAVLTEIDYGDRVGKPKLEPMALGPVPTDPKLILEYFREFKFSIPEQYRSEGLYVAASKTICERYVDAKSTEAKHSQQYAPKMYIDGSSMQLRHFPGMEDSDLVFAYAPGNLIRIINRNDGATQNFEVNDAEMYILRAKAGWHECYGFGHFDYVFATNQIPPA